MTSSSSSKTEFICIFYDVFDVGVFVGSSLIEVSHLYIIGIFILPLLKITLVVVFSIRSSYAKVMAVLALLVPSGCSGSLLLSRGSTALASAVVSLIAGTTALASGSTSGGKWGGSGNSREAPDSSSHLSGVPRQPSSRSGSSGGSTKRYYRRPFYCCSVLLVGGSTAPRGGTTVVFCVWAVLPLERGLWG